MAAKRKVNSVAEAKPLTPEQRDFDLAAIKRKQARQATAAPAMRMAKHEGGTLGVRYRDDAAGWALMAEALGTDDRDFTDGLLTKLANAVSTGREVDVDALNFALAVVQGLRPRDHAEAMLAAQMATIHDATMTFARRLKHVETLPQQDSAERTLNKLARTFVAQIEALKRYRSAGEQTVRVEHVHVHAGGQAVVGNVAGGRGADPKPEPTP